MLFDPTYGKGGKFWLKLSKYRLSNQKVGHGARINFDSEFKMNINIFFMSLLKNDEVIGRLTQNKLAQGVTRNRVKDMVCQKEHIIIYINKLWVQYYYDLIPSHNTKGARKWHQILKGYFLAKLLDPNFKVCKCEVFHS